MKRWVQSADQWIRQSSWKDVALLKFCLAAMGILIGLQVEKEDRNPVALGAGAVFLVTYFLLMKKYLRILLHRE